MKKIKKDLSMNNIINKFMKQVNTKMSLKKQMGQLDKFFNIQSHQVNLCIKYLKVCLKKGIQMDMEDVSQTMVIALKDIGLIHTLKLKEK